ncbi:MAG: 4Fe-4S dicluster domain-containing protein [Dehalococcoidia bacterium]
MKSVRWGKVIDNTRCIGCHACTIACKAEHDVPLGVTRTYVKQVEVGHFPDVRRHFQVTRCNQCGEPPCVDACPVTAMFRRPDGIVDFDRERCIGCGACMAACPYDAIYLNPQNHSAEKCNFCAHRIDLRLEPACVAVCPTQAIIVGDLNDPGSEVSRIISCQKVDVRRLEKGTQPRLFYVEATQFTLIPTAALQETLQMATEVQGGPAGRGFAGSAREGERASSIVDTAAAALLAYDNTHQAPWDWRVSAYTWTKFIATGPFLTVAVLTLAGDELGSGWERAAGGVSLGFLVLTGAILVFHLTHPRRFFYILRWPQRRSWLARGAYVITGYGLLLVAFVGASLAGAEAVTTALLWPGAVAATLTAIYTAFLLRQSKGRDLWQSRLLPFHFAVQAAVAGFATLYLIAAARQVESRVLAHMAWGLTAAVAGHLALALAEAAMPQATADGARAAHNLVRGRHRASYRGGVLLGGVIPVVLATLGMTLGRKGPLQAAAALSLVGLALYEHAYIQAGQSLPLS